MSLSIALWAGVVDPAIEFGVASINKGGLNSIVTEVAFKLEMYKRMLSCS
jgi:hypothetical protein